MSRADERRDAPAPDVEVRTTTKLSTRRVAVTALADFACRRGDLEGGGAIGPSAREGIRAHQRAQVRECERSPSVLSEQRVRADIDGQLVSPGNTLQRLQLTGRIDLCDPEAGTLTEIKSTLVPLAHVADSQQSLHWAQAMLYAYCLMFGDSVQGSADASDGDPIAEQQQPGDGQSGDGQPGNGQPEIDEQVPGEAVVSHPAGQAGFATLDRIGLRLLYIDLRAGTEEIVSQTLSRDAVHQFARDAADRYLQWLDLLEVRQRATRESAQTLAFPYGEFRAGQRDMAAMVWRGVRDRTVQLCEAPTGIGKTISSLYPAVKALADGSLSHITYLTAKTSGRRAAMQAVSDLETAGLPISAVSIRAKRLTCFCSNGRSERDADGRCDFCIGFFDRLPDARLEAMTLGVIDGEALDALAWKHRVCPFELSLQLLPWVSLAICDYNYVFDPLVRLGWFAESRRDTVLLVDEAHNLPDRARGMYSAVLERGPISLAARECATTHRLLSKRLGQLADSLLRVSRQARDLARDDTHASTVSVAVTTDDVLLPDGPPTTVGKAVLHAVEALMDAWSAEGPMLPETFGELFRALFRYLAIAELYGDNHRTLCRTTPARGAGRLDVQLSLLCLDASAALARQYTLFRSVSLFSATLRPMSYYRDALGLGGEVRTVQLPSPFDPANARQLVVPWVDTRYRQRAASLDALCDVLHAVFHAHGGNYLVFFPSYRYLQDAQRRFTERYPGVPVWQQSADADAETRDGQLQALDTGPRSLGFAILGGVFGEGVDYVGDRLVGVVIVGVGLPGLGTEQELIAGHCRALGLDGYDYAYRYPGFTRVLQSAGRVIRSESDRGVVVLVDPRYREQRYRTLFPPHWQGSTVHGVGELRQGLDAFWAEQSRVTEMED